MWRGTGVVCVLVMLACGCSKKEAVAPQGGTATATAAAAGATTAPANNNTGGAKPAETAATAAGGATTGTTAGAAAGGADCVKDIKTHAATALKKVASDLSVEEFASALTVGTEWPKFGDLDGDGTPETTAYLGTGTPNVDMAVYLSNKGCPKLALQLNGAGVGAATSKTDGVTDISSWAKGGCAGLEGTLTLYTFDKARGVYGSSAKTVECSCNYKPDRHPACPEHPDAKK